MIRRLFEIFKDILETDLKSGVLKLEYFPMIAIKAPPILDLSFYIQRSINAWILMTEKRGNKQSNIREVIATFQSIIGEHHEVFDYFELD